MLKKFIVPLALACTLLLAGGCHHKVQNPLANVDSKQPDKVLYDRAMDSEKHGRYQEARTLLETLINTYPDSEFIARAKLGVGDSWYAEGGTAAWQQAEVEYKDFQTFFPNLPEASEAQLKVANIHYRQMEKPDRDFAQAVRAEDEYKNLIQTYPDSPLVPEAKQRLREVQEVLAERQYRIAHFYFLRNNLAASQARLESLVDSYPLYSGADEALLELGDLYAKEAESMKKQANVPAAIREKIAANYQKRAIEAYSRIITRYPAMDRANDAKKRLAALNAPVPTPTADAMTESKAEEESRGSTGMVQGLKSNFQKHPLVAKAARVGEPNLAEEQVKSAPALIQDLQNQMNASSNNTVGVETVRSGKGDAGPNQAPPSAKEVSGDNEGAPPTPAPGQVNQAAGAAPQDQESANKATQAAAQNVSGTQDSTSKKKKKSALRKLVPF
ncbi:MAG TPA: outer membrane protein assembly factor BamD [Candidatus Limnocylindrales bacterium]|nr:outer membrane protein assembly factor BamD [Candidatus Limnocylindrales bacterium]